MTAVGVDALLSLFPPGSSLDPDGMLAIDGCRADALATEFGTPVLVVAERALRMQGLHVHVGSQILDLEPFAQSVAPVAALGEYPVYDLGGGLGARYSYDDHPPAVGGTSTR